MSSVPTDHPPASILADYQAGRLAPTQVLAISDHLADCPSCREMLLGLRGRVAPVVERIEMQPADDPPTFAELAALLDGDLSAEQSASLRTRLAAELGYADELKDLETFRREMSALPPKLHGLGSVLAENHALVERVPPSSGKILPFPRGRWMPLAAAAAVLLVFAGWWTLAGTRNHQAPSLWTTNGQAADLAALPKDLRGSVEEAARTGDLELPILPAVLRPSRGTLAGPASGVSAFTQLAPVGAIVRGTHPRLSWTPCAGATGYVVYLVPVNAPDSLRRQDIPASQSDWTPSEPLTRGTIYEWQVEARSNGETLDRAPRPPAPESRFQVLSADSAAKLDKLDRFYAAYPLILGTAYARAGLTKETAAQFQKLSRQHPDSAIAKRLERETTQANLVEK